MLDYVTSWEERGIAKGFAQGRAEGRAEGKAEGRAEAWEELKDKVIAALTARFGTLDESDIMRVRSTTTVDELFELFMRMHEGPSLREPAL